MVAAILSDFGGEELSILDQGDACTTIDALEPIYFLNEHDVDVEVFQPIMRVASSIDCMAGYFSSGALSELAVSLSVFLTTERPPIRFIVSPSLSKEDLDALKAGARADRNLIPLLFPGYEPSEDNLRTRAVEALAYLVASHRMEFRVGLQSDGIFHTKCWLFQTSRGLITIHGSSNPTGNGLSVNTEQITLDAEWESEKSCKVVRKIKSTFEKLWEGVYPTVETIELNDRTLKFLEAISPRKASGLDWKSYLDENPLAEHGDARKPQRLQVPDWLNYESGDFAHQGEAISAWLRTGRGILSIATGGGKSLTALVAASLVGSTNDQLLVVVAVPTVTLLNQWAEDAKAFAIEPLNANGKPSKELRKELKMRLRHLRHGISDCEVLIVTHDALKSELINDLEIASRSVPIMLIGDEVHNLGSSGFQQHARDCFRYRMGLSATYERQFDEEGTAFLLQYFGEVVFDFPLTEAIGKCLVGFDYHVHKVYLDEQEEEDWADLTAKIRQLSYAAELADGAPEKERWKLCCLKRRRIVESASGKIAALAASLPATRSSIKRTLIFCTDKAPKQLEALNSLLMERSINFHQVTHTETADPKTLKKIVESFNAGDLQVLTSKRVLDEGFNVPQTEVAYILASNTVKRQWVQRLGRILRLSPSTGKEKAVVHDFVVVPNAAKNEVDPDLRSLIMGEYSRVSFFSSLSNNGLESNGALSLMEELLELVEARD